ncbi:hypothetical protein MYCTH_36377, partial [Thermothelomyces thermophilus ATCC 42464]
MPSRKSDARRNDVSVARFVLAEDDSAMATESSAPGPASSSSAPSASKTDHSASGPAPGTQQQHQQQQQHQSGEKKEKERDKDKDNLTIEIQANAILALTKSATVFINHLANAANEFTVRANKKTIMPADVFSALDEIEYGFMRERLEAEFASMTPSSPHP